MTENGEEPMEWGKEELQRQEIMALQWLCPLVPSLSSRFHWICCIMDAMLPVEVISLNDKPISTALLFFPIDFIKRNILMAMSIIVVEMAVRNLFFCLWNSEYKDRATHTAYLTSCHANVTSAMSYDKKKPDQNLTHCFLPKQKFECQT